MHALLVDLDDTLFDHGHATREALRRLRALEPRWADWPDRDFETRHSDVLERLHQEVLTGRLTVDAARVERFRRLLAAAAVEDRAAAARAVEIAAAYREAYAGAWRAVPGAVELLAAVTAAGTPVVVVTNNLVAEQRLKLERCGLTRYVSGLVTSEEVGHAKPRREIFETALAAAGVSAEAAVMLGDAWLTDIAGARAAGIRAVWLNRLGVPSPDPDVPELRSLLPTPDVMRMLGADAGESDRRCHAAFVSRNPP